MKASFYFFAFVFSVSLRAAEPFVNCEIAPDSDNIAFGAITRRCDRENPSRWEFNRETNGVDLPVFSIDYHISFLCTDYCKNQYSAVEMAAINCDLKGKPKISTFDISLRQTRHFLTKVRNGGWNSFPDTTYFRTLKDCAEKYRKDQSNTLDRFKRRTKDTYEKPIRKNPNNKDLVGAELAAFIPSNEQVETLAANSYLKTFLRKKALAKSETFLEEERLGANSEARPLPITELESSAPADLKTAAPEPKPPREEGGLSSIAVVKDKFKNIFIHNEFGTERPESQLHFPGVVDVMYKEKNYRFSVDLKLGREINRNPSDGQMRTRGIQLVDPEIIDEEKLPSALPEKNNMALKSLIAGLVKDGTLGYLNKVEQGSSGLINPVIKENIPVFVSFLVKDKEGNLKAKTLQFDWGSEGPKASSPKTIFDSQLRFIPGEKKDATETDEQRPSTNLQTE